MIESFLIGWIFERVLIKYSGNTYLFKFGMTKEKYVNIEKDLNHIMEVATLDCDDPWCNYIFKNND